MALFDAEIVLEDVRYFREGDGKVHGVFLVVHSTPAPTEAAAEESSFSGQSYLNLELFLDNPREVEALRVGETIHVTLDVTRKEETSWASRSTQSE